MGYCLILVSFAVTQTDLVSDASRSNSVVDEMLCHFPQRRRSSSVDCFQAFKCSEEVGACLHLGGHGPSTHTHVRVNIAINGVLNNY